VLRSRVEAIVEGLMVPGVASGLLGGAQEVKKVGKEHLPVDWEKLTYEDLTQALADCEEKGGKPDLCVMDPPICRGNFGKDRAQMPQFPGEKVPELLKALHEKGVDTSEESVPVRDLKATQDEINAKKVAGMVKTMNAGAFRPGTPILVSRDSYVLDGHHRWAAQWVLDKDAPLPVVRIDMPMQELLNFADRYSGKKKGFDERVERLVDGLLEMRAFNTMGYRIGGEVHCWRDAVKKFGERITDRYAREQAYPGLEVEGITPSRSNDPLLKLVCVVCGKMLGQVY
jgi:hypothetical protein